MLQLKSIVKHYAMADRSVEALRGIDLEFRKSEFVAILGPSGCGKTTLLNIIGGLDRYTSGDLVVNGLSTKKFKDVDWDIYRNNSIGFVFQNYNLIPHQSVLSNVELALTLAGISRAERRRRATEALVKVGLAGHLQKRPNQLSGGEMQRVAIARALVNDPDILLADEPTGALDTGTSAQIMAILKEISRERLIIMVTHNSEIARAYSTRIIRLLDGSVTDDTAPYHGKEQSPVREGDQGRKKKRSMSFLTALSLSLNNLMTKKARTFLTAFAGSIGIIGIALILSLSSGMQAYIKNMQEDTLSTYPLQISGQSMDMAGMMGSMMRSNRKSGEEHELDRVYANNITTDMMKGISAQVAKNDLKRFKVYLDSEEGCGIRDISNAVQYGYGLELQLYSADTADGILKVNPSDILSLMWDGGGSPGNGMMHGGGTGVSVTNAEIWTEMIGNQALLEKQYELLAGSWPTSYDEVVLVVDENNELSDTVLYALGLLDQAGLKEMKEKIEKGESIAEAAGDTTAYSYAELLGLSFKLLLNTDRYEKEMEKGLWVDRGDEETYMKPVIGKAQEIRVAGIIRPQKEVTATSISGAVAYTAELARYVMDRINEAEIVKEQKAEPEINVLTGLPFDMDDYTDNLTMDDLEQYLQTLPAAGQKQMQGMMSSLTEEEALAAFAGMMRDAAGKATTYEDNLVRFGVVDLDNPDSISIYPKDYDSKESVSAYIEDYNRAQKEAGHDEYVISYSDMMAVMMSSVTSIVNIITYVLIAFVAISLVVSSLMIGIITYISVLERTKEIGILRSIGASKKDISRVFNAETIIVGFVAGALGILITLLLNIPISYIINRFVDVSGLARLPVYGAVGLIIISVLLTVIAGLLPSRIAARKDPVEALRTE
ncbi:MAG: ABC transporter ATP-binding protein/permease [Firmicutes bacterium]|nr:ABC transporter ATP-binding protein/permease [Bacillota bacterium]